jgi:PAS domain S-box-containing protein
MLSSIVAKSNDLFIVTEADEVNPGGDDRRIIYVNEAFCRFSGYSYDEIIGKTPSILRGGKTDPVELEKIRIALNQGIIYNGELFNYKKNNEEYLIDLNITPLTNEDGKIIQFASVQRDITERKSEQHERERLIEELSDSNEELERFAYVCSHDLQEPLRMIRCFSEKLQTHIASDLENDEKGIKYFKFITEGAVRAQRLIADILEYSSISNDTQQLQRVSGQELIDNIKQTMQLTLLESGARITNEPLPELQGNQTQLYQLFQNLINNAVKYQESNTIAQVHISVDDADKFWKFSVSDNGIGIESRHLGKIFDVFQRLHRKSQYAGTGIGLSICKKIVTRHGGTLWVESEPGVGTTFKFTLLKPTPMEIDYSDQRKAS